MSSLSITNAMYVASTLNMANGDFAFFTIALSMSAGSNPGSIGPNLGVSLTSDYMQHFYQAAQYLKLITVATPTGLVTQQFQQRLLKQHNISVVSGNYSCSVQCSEWQLLSVSVRVIYFYCHNIVTEESVCVCVCVCVCKSSVTVSLCVCVTVT
jgi:hypothetical protein